MSSLCRVPSSLSKPIIPKRGEKEFEPAPGGGSGLQEYSLDRSRQAMVNALKGVRGISRYFIAVRCNQTPLTNYPLQYLVVNQSRMDCGYLAWRVPKCIKHEVRTLRPSGTQSGEMSLPPPRMSSRGIQLGLNSFQKRHCTSLNGAPSCVINHLPNWVMKCNYSIPTLGALSVHPSPCSKLLLK